MSRALLIVDHGSRRSEAHTHLERVAAEVRRLAPGLRVHVGHMDVVPPSVSEAIATCVRDGAEEVVVHPFFLVPGLHLTHDLPSLVAAAAREHPGVRIRMTAPLGSMPGLADLVLQSCQSEGGGSPTEGDPSA
jgi:sirohydrochlorin ferrochelatase